MKSIKTAFKIYLKQINFKFIEIVNTDGFRLGTVYQNVMFISHFFLKFRTQFWKYFRGMVLQNIVSDHRKKIEC